MTYTEFYCDPVNGSNLNAGSANAAPVYTGVGDSDGTSVFTPSDGSTPASTVSVGMFASIYVTSGATVAVYISRITAVAAGVNGAITTSTTAKAGTIPTNSAGAHTITCVVGGYQKGPNGAVGFPFGFITATLTDAAGDFPRVNFINSATYSITAAMTHSIAGPCYFQGMTTTPGDLGRAIIDGGTSGASYVLLAVSGTQDNLRDLIFQNNGATGAAVGLLLSGSRIFAERLTVNSTRGAGFSFSTLFITGIECEAYGCNQNNSASSGGFLCPGLPNLRRCISHDNTGSNNCGFVFTGNGSNIVSQDCVAGSNGLDGFRSTGSTDVICLGNFTAYNNGGSGVFTTSGLTAFLLVENSVLAGNGAFGVNNAGTTNVVRLSSNAYYSNTSGQTNGVKDETGAITCTVQPMNDPANGDFSLNNTAGGGALCRNLGRGKYTQNAGSFTKTTTGFPDVGVQHQDAGGGSSGGTPILQSGIIQGLGAI